MIQFNDRELHILRLRQRKVTYVDISNLYGISRERARQIHQNTLKKFNKIKELI